MSTVTPIPSSVHPSGRRGLEALAMYLMLEGYTPHSREKAVEHVACHGTLEGLVYLGLLEAEDEAAAEEAYVSALEPVSRCSAEWSDPAEWTLTDEAELEAIDRENGYDLRTEPDELPGPPSAAEQAEIERQTDLADTPPPIRGGAPRT